jgi:uncharacterized membrane protein
MMFRSEGEKQVSRRQQIITVIFTVFLLALYFLNLVPLTDTDIKINNLWIFFFPIQILLTLYSAWHYSKKSENLLFLQSVLLLLSWLTRYSTTFNPSSFITNSYFIYDLSGTFEIGFNISVEEILYAIFSITAIGLSIWPSLKRRLLKKSAVASLM